MSMELILIAAMFVAVYAGLANRLFVFARPLRDDAVDIAESIGADARFSEARRLQAVRMAAQTTSTRMAWLLVVLFLVVIFENAISWLASKGRESRPLKLEGVPHERSADWRRVVRATVLASLCSSPAALVIFGFMIGAASFVRSGADLADAALNKASSREAKGRDDICPPAFPA